MREVRRDHGNSKERTKILHKVCRDSQEDAKR